MTVVCNPTSTGNRLHAAWRLIAGGQTGGPSCVLIRFTPAVDVTVKSVATLSTVQSASRTPRQTQNGYHSPDPPRAGRERPACYTLRGGRGRAKNPTVASLAWPAGMFGRCARRPAPRPVFRRGLALPEWGRPHSVPHSSQVVASALFALTATTYLPGNSGEWPGNSGEHMSDPSSRPAPTPFPSLRTLLTQVLTQFNRNARNVHNHFARPIRAQNARLSTPSTGLRGRWISMLRAARLAQWRHPWPTGHRLTQLSHECAPRIGQPIARSRGASSRAKRPGTCPSPSAARDP